MRVVDSVQARLEEMKDVGVLEQHIRHRVPVEVIGMPGQRVEGGLIQPSPPMLDSRWCVLQDQMERQLLRRARRQRPVASRQVGGQVIVGPGCTAPPCSILAPRQPRVAVEEVPPGPLWQKIAPVVLDVVVAVVGKNLGH